MASEIIKCRKPECSVAIRMLQFRKTGNPAPIEADPSPDGNIHVDLDQGTYIILTGEELTKARARQVPLHLNHFVTCEFAKEFSKSSISVSLPVVESLMVAKFLSFVLDVVKVGHRRSCPDCDSALRSVHVASDGYRCPYCKVKICIICGCTEKRACFGGCSWAAPGFCSAHTEEIETVIGVVAEEAQLIKEERV